jgi:hypothetical protein
MMFEDFAHNGGYVINRAVDFKFFNQSVGAGWWVIFDSGS